MEVEFDDKALQRAFSDAGHTVGRGHAIDRQFRKVVGIIRAAADERDLRALRGLAFEKLKGRRAHQCSLRLNDQWRLIIEIRGQPPNKKIGIVAVEDYH
jgi:proteic killer suppression protein